LLAGQLFYDTRVLPTANSKHCRLAEEHFIYYTDSMVQHCSNWEMVKKTEQLYFVSEIREFSDALHFNDSKKCLIGDTQDKRTN
jgi:hypothetical protein